GIPFIAFDAATTPEELSKQLKQTKAAALISDKKLESLQADTHVIPSETFSLTKILEPDFTPQKSVKRRKEEVQSNQNRIWGYFFTSGTTGSPKIVPLKRRQMLFAAKASAQNLQPDRNGLWLLCMPLHHICGITVIIRSLLYGTGIYRLHRFESSSVTQLFFENPRLQAASLVPTMLKRLLDRSEFTAPDYFKAILLGGGPVSESLIDCCFERGIPIISSYGMTESCAQIAANPLMTVGDLSRPKKSAGRIFSPNEIEIRTATGRAESRESGEIWLRGPQLFDGYLHPKESFDFDNNGWFNTGDFGYLNKNNELFIESRRTDLIISGGENLAPAEVEEALERCPQVREAVVVGIADEEWGQKAVALVTVQAERGQIDRKKLKKELSYLEPFKIPKKIIPVKELPRSKTGKLLRSRSKEMAIKLI